MVVVAKCTWEDYALRRKPIPPICRYENGTVFQRVNNGVLHSKEKPVILVGQVPKPYKFQALLLLEYVDGFEKCIYKACPQSGIPWQVAQYVLSVGSCQEICLDDELCCISENDTYPKLEIHTAKPNDFIGRKA